MPRARFWLLDPWSSCSRRTGTSPSPISPQGTSQTVNKPGLPEGRDHGFRLPRGATWPPFALDRHPRRQNRLNYQCRGALDLERRCRCGEDDAPGPYEASLVDNPVADPKSRWRCFAPSIRSIPASPALRTCMTRRAGRRFRSERCEQSSPADGSTMLPCKQVPPRPVPLPPGERGRCGNPLTLRETAAAGNAGCRVRGVPLAKPLETI